MATTERQDKPVGQVDQPQPTAAPAAMVAQMAALDHQVPLPAAPAAELALETASRAAPVPMVN
jgi:hypothetical protein